MHGVWGQIAKIHKYLRCPINTQITAYFKNSNTKHTLIYITTHIGNLLSTTAVANVYAVSIGV